MDSLIALCDYVAHVRNLWNHLPNLPQFLSRRWHTVAATPQETTEEDIDVPEEFKDPISFSAMVDPVVLVPTGQVYDYDSLRQWFAMGQRVCPMSTKRVDDAQICRLPALRSRINSWREENGLEVPPQTDFSEYAELDPDLPACLSNLKRGDAAAVLQAVIDMNNMLCRWQSDSNEESRSQELQEDFRRVIVEDLITAIRFGDSYMQGISANLLGFADTEEEFEWLAASAAMPLCHLLFSPNLYANQAAARVIMNLCRRSEHTRQMLRKGGVIEGMLKQLQDSQKFPYCRSMAASSLAGMAALPECRSEILQRGGVQKLLSVFSDTTSRFEQSDCALALLVLGVTEEDLQPYSLKLKDLHYLSFCSVAWLRGEVNGPREGLTDSDRLRIEGIHGAIDRNIVTSLEDLTWLIMEESEEEEVEEPEEGEHAHDGRELEEHDHNEN